MSRVAPTVRIGTRGSPLARWQADHVAAALRRLGANVEIITITTHGDQTKGPISESGAEGVFTKRIQRGLLENEVDLAVHSLKDLPTVAVEGIVLTAVPPREHAGDALVSSAASSLDALPSQSRVGTGSLRRRAQLLHVRPDLQVSDIRGNVDTRLAKLDAGEFDAILLAVSGLLRLGLEERITERLPTTVMLPAVGQGALGIECRSDDSDVRQLLAPLDDRDTRAAVLAERAMLAKLRGGCLAPVGAHGRVERQTLQLTGVVLSGDGKTRLWAEKSAELAQPQALGKAVADDLLAQGAGRLLDAQRDNR